jgi:hypothetical protein
MILANQRGCDFSRPKQSRPPVLHSSRLSIPREAAPLGRVAILRVHAPLPFRSSGSVSRDGAIWVHDEYACAENDIDHILMRFSHPWPLIGLINVVGEFPSCAGVALKHGRKQVHRPSRPARPPSGSHLQFMARVSLAWAGARQNRTINEEGNVR